MEEGHFKHMASSSGFGYAYHKIIIDDNNKPIDYIFLETNSFFAEVIGINTLEFINHKISEILPDFFQSDYERIKIYGNIAINGGEQSFEFYSETLNRWYKVLVSSTEKLYFTTIYTDITNYKTEDFDRKQIEEYLRESEEKYRLLIQNSHDIIYTLNSDGFFTFVSFAWTSILGHSSDEVIGKSFQIFVHPEDVSKLVEWLQKAIQLEQRQEGIEYRVQHIDKSWHWQTTSVVPLRNKDNKIIGFEGTARDITEHKKNEEDRIRQAGLVSSLLDSIPDIIFFKDVNGIYLGCNPPFAKFVGKAKSEILGKTDIDLFGKETGDFFRHHDQEMLKQKQPRHNEEWITYPDGKKILIDTLKTPYWGSEGSLIGILGISRDITERKETERKIIESETNFHTFFETMDDLIFVSDMQGKIVFTNDAVSIKLGYSLEELKTLHVLDIHPASSQIEAEQIFNDMLSGNRDFCPLPLAKKDKSLVPVETRIWFGKWDGNDCIFGISKDLSKEQELLQKFNKIFDNNPALMAISSIPERIFSEVNQSFLSKTGYTKEEIIGKTAKELGFFIQPEKQKIISKELEEKGFIHNLEQKIKIKSGDILDGIFSGEIIESQGKKYFLTVMLDVTDSKKLEEDIKLQNNFYNVISKVSERLIQTDSSALDLEINQSLEALGLFNKVDRAYVFELEIAKQELNNTFEWCADGVLPEIENLKNIPFSFIPYWKESFLNNKHIYIESVQNLPQERHSEKEILEPQGIQSLVTVPMFYGSKLIGFLGFDSVREIKQWNEQVIILLKIYASVLAGVIFKKKTEAALLKAKQEADAANKIKSEFLANMSHEIRTPLNGVIGFTDLLLKTTLNNTQQEYALNANTSGHTLLTIINDILDFSKIEAGKMELDFTKTDIIELVEHASDIIKYQASLKGLEFLLNIQPNIPRFALVDSIRLKQILVNLLGNAVKFTESGEIELKVTFNKKDKSSGYFCFSVRDTGIGISEEQQKRLFKAFSQADTSTTRKFGGTGLGLVISSMLAEKMGSTIELISQCDQGSNFFFTIETEYIDGEKLDTRDLLDINRVLIIDDNYNNRLILEHTFKNWNIECTVIDNGLSAINLLKDSKLFDVIIVDYHMPYLNGLDTIKIIREQLHLTADKQPIILLHSSSDDVEIFEECKKMGVRYNLTKPVKSQELFQYLKSLHKQAVVKDFDHNKELIRESTAFFKTSSPKILVAEDVDLNMILVTSIIKAKIPNAIIFEAKTGKEALNSMIENSPDIVFMDIQMPVMSGIEATKERRSLEQLYGGRIPIIALTAGVIKGEKEKCLLAGMDGFLSKPINHEELLCLLEKHLFFDSKINKCINQGSENDEFLHFDKPLLLQRIDNDFELLQKLFDSVLSQIPLCLENLVDAVQQENLDEIKDVVHKIKGISLNMCFNHLAELAIEMELNPNYDHKKKSIVINAMVLEWEKIKSKF